VKTSKTLTKSPFSKGKRAINTWCTERDGTANRFSVRRIPAGTEGDGMAKSENLQFPTNLTNPKTLIN